MCFLQAHRDLRLQVDQAMTISYKDQVVWMYSRVNSLHLTKSKLAYKDYFTKTH